MYISERLLRLYRFVPRSRLDNFTGYICLTGGCSGFASGSLKADAWPWRNPVPSYLSFYGRSVVCYSFLLCHLRYSQHYAKANFVLFHKIRLRQMGRARHVARSKKWHNTEYSGAEGRILLKCILLATVIKNVDWTECLVSTVTNHLVPKMTANFWPAGQLADLREICSM